MHLPPLSSPVVSGYYSSGDVSIAGDVVMAAGVILHANPGYFIRLEPGVCLGLGVILHASEGNIVVRANAILGAGVLVVGWAEIGSQACLGSSVTVFKATIAAGEMVAPGSLLGQRGRIPDPSGETVTAPQVPGSFSLGQHFSLGQQWSRTAPMEYPPVQEPRPQEPILDPPPPAPLYEAATVDPEPIAPSPDPYPSASPFPESSPSEPPVPDIATAPEATPETSAPPPAVPPSPDEDPTPAIEEDAPVPESGEQAPPSSPMAKGQPSKVYGKDYFLQMRFAMFPHRSEPLSSNQAEFTD